MGMTKESERERRKSGVRICSRAFSSVDQPASGEKEGAKTREKGRRTGVGGRWVVVMGKRGEKEEERDDFRRRCARFDGAKGRPLRGALARALSSLFPGPLSRDDNPSGAPLRGAPLYFFCLA